MVVPVLREFGADLVIASVGFDAHASDPLAQMQVTDAGYRSMVGTLWATAAEASRGRLVVLSEGGYDLAALAAGLEATVEVLDGAPAVPTPARASGPGIRGREAADAALASGERGALEANATPERSL